MSVDMSMRPSIILIAIEVMLIVVLLWLAINISTGEAFDPSEGKDGLVLAEPKVFVA
jgi:hypothetical protein